MTDIIIHLSQSHRQMARILDAEARVTVRMSEMVQSLPDVHPQFDGLSGVLDSSSLVTKSIIAYLNGLAELEASVADSLTNVVMALGDDADEE